MHRQIGRPLAWRIRRTLTVGIAVLTALLLQSNSHLYVQSSDIIAEGDPMPSIAHPPGSDDAELLTRSGHEFNGPNFVRGNKSFSKRNRLNHDIDPTRSLPSPSVADSQMSIQAATKVDQVVEGFGFNDNAAEIGFFLIPPDPHGAVGKNRVIAIGNAIIECRTREGDLKWRDALRDFFAPLTPTTLIFDPKIVYDQYEDRFVAVALVMAGTATVSPSNISRILVAVSKDGNPRTPTSADWYYHAIDAKTLIGTLERWADYPGFAVDEEAIYINANMFSFSTGSFGGVRLWIIDKGALGGFYAGGPAGVTAHNPYATAGIATTTQPAHVFGDGGGGPTTGTYLVSYSGLSDGVDEYVQIVRVDNPLGTTSFAQQFVNVGNLESFPGGGVLLDAPQLGGSALIEVNDRRALNAVWIDNELWMTAELRPNSGPDRNQTTAHWWNLDTTVPALIALADQGNIGGEDIAPGTYTYYPAVAVNRDGFAAFGFSASAPTIYAGAFVTGRAATDAAGTVQSSQVVHSGVDFYLRRFSANPAARNRWGDFTSVVVDPTNNDFFWVFNEFADVQGTPLVAGDGQGRWRMTWARYRSN